MKTEEVCGQILCYHAKLCVLAQRYLVEPLKELCKVNLWHALHEFDLNNATTNDVLDLVYYVYTEEGMDGVPEVRSTIILHVAAKIKELRGDPRLRLMMMELSALGTDLAMKLAEGQ